MSIYSFSLQFHAEPDATAGELLGAILEQLSYLAACEQSLRCRCIPKREAAELAERVRQLREAAGLTQQQLGEAAGFITPENEEDCRVAYIEEGRYWPGPQDMRTLAHDFGVDELIWQFSEI